MEPRNLKTLVDAIESGVEFEFLYFWGHRVKRGNPVSKSCLSQWYPAEFESEGVRYRTAEHFMMAKKAELFGQPQLSAEIVRAEDPAVAKSLGRKVKNFKEDVWEDARWGIVVAANTLKFRQNPGLLGFLLNTAPKVLVEASPLDLIWGIGMDETAAVATSPAHWPGQNLLGFALMEVRNNSIRY